MIIFSAVFLGFIVVLLTFLFIIFNACWFSCGCTEEKEKVFFARGARYTGYTILWMAIWLIVAERDVSVKYTPVKVENYTIKDDDLEKWGETFSRNNGNTIYVVTLPNGKKYNLSIMGYKVKEGQTVYLVDRGTRYGIDFSGNTTISLKKD